MLQNHEGWGSSCQIVTLRSTESSAVLVDERSGGRPLLDIAAVRTKWKLGVLVLRRALGGLKEIGMKRR